MWEKWYYFRHLKQTGKGSSLRPCEQPRQSASAQVAFENVGLRRGETCVFAGLDLRLVERRIGLIGSNGAGKSSMLRLINGLLLPDAGKVTVCGLDTRKHRRSLPALAGFLFQNPEHQILFPTVGEEIAFGLREAGFDPHAAAARTNRILEAWNWADWGPRPVQDLSDGQKQRLCIIAVLALEPALLLLDEPFASLDLPSRTMIAREMMASPQQIVMASHDLSWFDPFDRVIWLEKGRVAADGPPAQVIAAYRRSFDNELRQAASADLERDAIREPGG